MSHEIETNFYVDTGDGKGVPWHGLGVALNNPATSAEAIIAAGLDWEVGIQPLFAEDYSGKHIEVETNKAVIRKSDNSILGIVGTRYTPVQNLDAFNFVDALVEDGSMRYHTAGSLRNGQRIWLLGQVGSSYILPEDKIDQFLFLYNTHDGTGALRCLFTTVRVVCANTARIALSQGKGEGIAIKHTVSIARRIEQAKKILGLSRKEFQEYEEFCKELTGLSMPTKRWNEFSEQLIPDNPETDSNARAENSRLQLTELYESGRGSEIKGVKGTGWAALASVVEFANYYRSSRGGDEAQARRFESSLFGSGAELIQKGTNLLGEYLKAAA